MYAVEYLKELYLDEDFEIKKKKIFKMEMLNVLIYNILLFDPD